MFSHDQYIQHDAIRKCLNEKEWKVINLIYNKKAGNIFNIIDINLSKQMRSCVEKK